MGPMLSIMAGDELATRSSAAHARADRADGVAAGATWLGHPATLVAVLVLLANDHVAKHLWPGPVTGKVSDVAGLFVATPLVALALAAVGLRARAAVAAAVAATGVLFVLIKIDEDAAQVASAMWTAVAGPSRVLADPTDLLATPALGLAWWLGSRCLHRATVNAAADTPMLRRRLGVVVGLPLTLLATSATSYMGPAEVGWVADWNGEVVVDSDWSGPVASADGRGPWRQLSRAEQDALWEANVRDLAQTQACVAPLRTLCYRVAGRQLLVEQSHDAGLTWTPVWEISAGRREFLGRAYGPEAAQGERATHPLASRSIVLRTVYGGHVVVVANGLDGLLVRDIDGVWRRGFPSTTSAAENAPPLTDPWHRITTELLLAGLIGVVALSLGNAVARRRRRLTSPHLWWGRILAVAGMLILLVVRDFPLNLMAVPVGLVLAVAFTPVVLAEAVGIRPRWRSVLLIASAFATAAGIAAPFVGWSAGAPDDYLPAQRLAFVLGAIGFAITLAVPMLPGARPAAPPDDAGDPPWPPAPAAPAVPPVPAN
jgi:hypothetical protein